MGFLVCELNCQEKNRDNYKGKSENWGKLQKL
jgi:hypothetical protein